MDSGSRSIFAQNLIRYRKQRGLSQYDLANLTGISQRMIGHYETHASEPPIEKIEAIAKALGIKAAQLLESPATSTEDSRLDISDIDPRSIKKLKEILSLSPEDRNDLYRMLNKLLRKNQLERQQANNDDSSD
jgi:transcriptional regulator with XRE-family HTH domain